MHAIESGEGELTYWSQVDETSSRPEFAGWTWVPLDPAQGQVPFYYRVARVEPSGANPSLHGTIAIDMPTWHLATPADSMRWRITIWDRALNASNEITTPAFAKQ